MSQDRFRKAVDVLLRMQNSDGGFATYELTRGPKVLEWINPAEVFGDIMVEYSYPECTTAVVLGLLAFQKRDPSYRSAEIASTLQKAVKYIKKAQKDDGSWFGSWAICFTYATWFGCESLSATGETYSTSPTLQKTCDPSGWGTYVFVSHDL